MANHRIFSLVILAWIVASCGEKSAAQKLVIESLKDPDSAKFGEYTEVGDSGACLTVNAKNSMGGYTGDQEAVLMKLGGKWQVIAIEEVSKQRCIDSLKAAEENDGPTLQ